MQSSKKQKKISEIYFCIFKIYIKFQTFAKKNDPDSLCISGNPVPKKDG